MKYFIQLERHEYIFRKVLNNEQLNSTNFSEYLNVCEEFSLDYSKIKKYLRFIYEIKDKKNNYIMSTLNIKTYLLPAIALDLSNDVENY